MFYMFSLMKNFLIDHPEYKDKNQYCAIRELTPENIETKRAVIVLPWLMYRTYFSTWDLDSIVRESNKSAHIHFDYPKTEFDLDKVVGQIRDYIKQCPYDEIVIMGISFWDLIYRHLMNTLSDEDKSKIIHHISLNWVSTKEELSFQFKTLLSLTNIKSQTLNNLIWLFGIKNRKFGWIATKNQVYNKEFNKKIKINFERKEELRKKQKWHHKSASLWFTPWYVDRARIIANEKNEQNTEVPTSIIYSTNDEFFAKPKRNAEEIWKNIINDIEYYEVENWWHIWLVEYPEKYNPKLVKIFDKIWNK